MKNAITSVIVLLAATAFLAMQPSSYVRTLEVQASAGSWQAAARLAAYYDTNEYGTSTVEFGMLDLPTHARVVRPLHRDRRVAELWASAAAEMLFEDASEGEYGALAALALTRQPVLGRWLALDQVQRQRYLMQMLLTESDQPYLGVTAYRSLQGLDPGLAESIREEASEEGHLWPTLHAHLEYSQSGEWEAWLGAWSRALAREVDGARVEWATALAELRRQAEAGNEVSRQLLARVREYDEANPGLTLLVS